MPAIGSVLVIGATGQIGRWVVTEALAEGIVPVAASRDPARASRELGVEAVAFDADDAIGIRQNLGGADAVVMTHGGDSDPGAFSATADAVVSAAEELGKPVALMTSMGASRLPTGWARGLMAAKQQAEARLRAASVHYVIVRPGWFGYQGPADTRPDIRQGDEVTGQVGVDPRHVAQALLHGLSDANADYTLELFSKPGDPLTTSDDWARQFAVLTPDRPAAPSGAHV